MLIVSKKEPVCVLFLLIRCRVFITHRSFLQHVDRAFILLLVGFCRGSHDSYMSCAFIDDSYMTYFAQSRNSYMTRVQYLRESHTTRIGEIVYNQLDSTTHI